MQCRLCGSADDLITRPQRRPVCRDCDNRTQRESRYKRTGKRRELGTPYEYVCDTCGQSHAAVVSSGPDKRRCDGCVREVFNARARAKWREGHLRRTYGITVAEYKSMLRAQGGRCGICATPEPGGRHDTFAVDHDHLTGQVRGLLCDRCNIGLGYFKDDPDTLRAAIDYVGRDRQLRIV